jgi:hypothetical protein
MTNNNTNNDNENKFLKGTKTMTKSNKIPTRQMQVDGWTFIYTPSMHCMDVKSPDGRLEIIHNLRRKWQWFDVANKILARAEKS